MVQWLIIILAYNLAMVKVSSSSRRCSSSHRCSSVVFQRSDSLCPFASLQEPQWSDLWKSSMRLANRSGHQSRWSMRHRFSLLSRAVALPEPTQLHIGWSFHRVRRRRWHPLCQHQWTSRTICFRGELHQRTFDAVALDFPLVPTVDSIPFQIS